MLQGNPILSLKTDLSGELGDEHRTHSLPLHKTAFSKSAEYSWCLKCKGKGREAEGCFSYCLIYLFIYVLFFFFFFLSHDKPDMADLLDCVWGLMREISPENLYLLLLGKHLGDFLSCLSPAHTHKPGPTPPHNHHCLATSLPLCCLPIMPPSPTDTPVSSNAIMSHSHFTFAPCN